MSTSNNQSSQSDVANEPDHWATLRVQVRVQEASPDKLAQTVEEAETLGCMLAERDDVGGVEIRDPLLPPVDEQEFGQAPEFPELIVYTQEAALPALSELCLQWSQNQSLTIELSSKLHQGDEWRDAWKNFYVPIVLGDNRLRIRPSWLAHDPDGPKLELVLDPGRAFGTGLHESTRLVLELLTDDADSHFTDFPPRQMLDLGCGSGILGLSAAKLFSDSLTKIVMSDLDPIACEVTSENAELNHIQGIETIAAPVDKLPSSLGERQWELVFANIRPEVLIPFAVDIARFVAPQGVLFLSGILNDEVKSVLSAYEALSFTQIKSREENGWTALMLRSNK